MDRGTDRQITSWRVPKKRGTRFNVTQWLSSESLIRDCDGSVMRDGTGA